MYVRFNVITITINDQKRVMTYDIFICMWSYRHNNNKFKYF